ncbi:hypothetical protein [Lacisediminihabitans sp.]|uniref:hypothetical protein n=1 Tax=Lacisediminihabitans sp. TaxID=2787631 RepID=UPI002F93E340
MTIRVPTRAPAATAAGGLRYLWFAVSAFALSAFVPLLLLAQVENVGRSAAWIITLAIAVWTGLRMSAIIAAGRPMLFDFFFLMFCYVFMGLAPTVQIRSDLISTTTKGIDSGFDVPTAILVVTGIACYEIGRLVRHLRERASLGRAHGGAAEATAIRRARDRQLTKVSRVRSFLLIGFGIAFSAYFISKTGIGSLFASRDQAFAARSAAWPDPAIRSVMYSLAIYPLLVGIGAITQVRKGVRRGLSGWYLVVILAAVLVLLTIINPISSARYSLGTVLFALAIYAGAMLTARRVRVTLVAAIAGLIFVFPLADAFRSPTVNLVRAGFFGEYKSNPDYDAFWQIANAYSFVLDGLVHVGQQALGSLFFWVPRAVWPDKPLDTSILLANYRGYSFTNLSAPLWAEFLVNGGIPLLIIGFLLTGYLLRLMDMRLLPAFGGAGYWAIVGAIFPVYMTILLRGSLLQATGAVAVALACLLIVRKPQRSSPVRAPVMPGRRLRDDPLPQPSQSVRD